MFNNQELLDDDFLYSCDPNVDSGVILCEENLDANQCCGSNGEGSSVSTAIVNNWHESRYLNLKWL